MIFLQSSWCFFWFFFAGQKMCVADAIGNVKYNLYSLWTSPKSILWQEFCLELRLYLWPDVHLANQEMEYLIKQILYCVGDIFLTERRGGYSPPLLPPLLCLCLRWDANSTKVTSHPPTWSEWAQRFLQTILLLHDNTFTFNIVYFCCV